MNNQDLTNWLLSHYNAPSKTLDLTLGFVYETVREPVMFYQAPKVSTIKFEDPAYGRYVSQFMRDPNPFLNEYHVQKLILKNEKNNWYPAKDLAALVNNNELIALDLSGNGLVDNDVVEIFNDKKLNSLDLRNNNLTRINIYNNNALQTLNVASNQISSVNLYNNVLKSVNFENNKLAASAINTIANDNHIVSLNINNNLIGDGVCALQGSKMLQTLFARSNQIRPNGAEGIAKIPTLKNVDLSNNPVGDEGGQALAKNTNIEIINLKKTKISSHTAKSLLKNAHLVEAHVSGREVGLVNKFRLWKSTQKNAKTHEHFNESKKRLGFR